MKKMIIISVIIGIGLLSIGWFIGTKSVHTTTYLYPPKNQPFLEISKGEYVQISQREETKTYLGNPFAKEKHHTLFMMMDAFDFKDGGTYSFPSGNITIDNTISLGDNTTVK